MNRRSVALFLSTLALASGTAACGARPHDDDKPKQLDKQEHSSPANAPQHNDEGGEGGEGGEG